MKFRKMFALVFAVVVLNLVFPSSVMAAEANPIALSISVNDDMYPTRFDVYDIDGYYFFNLRNLARALDDSNKQFDVEYDDVTKAINITSNKSYSFIGTEVAWTDSEVTKAAMPTESKIYFNGQELNLTAFSIDGRNYFRLSEIMRLLDVFVGYDEEDIPVVIDIKTNKSYSEEGISGVLSLF